MFSFYSSVCKLFVSRKSVSSDIIDTPNLSRTVSKMSIIENDKIMLSPSSKSLGNIVSLNDAGERVIIEYSIFDSLFMHYRPKSKIFKK
jgi:hypothetical protein